MISPSDSQPPTRETGSSAPIHTVNHHVQSVPSHTTGRHTTLPATDRPIRSKRSQRRAQEQADIMADATGQAMAKTGRGSTKRVGCVTNKRLIDNQNPREQNLGRTPSDVTGSDHSAATGGAIDSGTEEGCQKPGLLQAVATVERASRLGGGWCPGPGMVPDEGSLRLQWVQYCC